MKHHFNHSEKEEKLRKSFIERCKSLKTGCDEFSCPDRLLDTDGLISLNDRIKRILEICNKKSLQPGYMLFFVMYDIGSNKVRNLIAKYLIKMGCVRIQKSIFLADLPSSTYKKISSDLSEVQSVYDNEDSILIVPISEGYLDAMHIIGEKLDMDIIMHRTNTLFF